MASWLKAAEDLFEVVDRRAKLVANELTEEQSELQKSVGKGQENQATKLKSKDKVRTRRSTADLSKPTTSGRDQGTAETSVTDIRENSQALPREVSENTSIVTKEVSSDPVTDTQNTSFSEVPPKDAEKGTTNTMAPLSVTERSTDIATPATDYSSPEISKDDFEKPSSDLPGENQAINGDNFAIAKAEVIPETNNLLVKVDGEKSDTQRMDETSSTNSSQAKDVAAATDPWPTSNKLNGHKDGTSTTRVQEQLDEAQGLLKTAVSTGQSKEARLARVCAGLSSRLQEYKLENAQLEELLVAERELSASYQVHIKQLQKELATSKAEVTRVESSMGDALVAKNSEIESLTSSVDTLKKQAAASEEKLLSLQENMDTILRSRELTETRMMQALREELATAERRAEEERIAHNATKMAAVEREVELEHRAVEASNALARIQRAADASSSRAMELEHKVALLEVECASLNQELQEMESRARRGQKKSSEEANQLLQIQAWQEEVERARQNQRDAENKLSSLEAEMQKMRVEMAGMRRDAEHYSRHEHMELEKRYRELTDLLYHKQTQLETMASEKAAAEFQLEKEVRRLHEAQLEAERSRSSRRASSPWEEDSDLKVLEPLPVHHRHMAGASKQLEKAAKLLDSGAVRATRFLWRYPYARVIFVFYLLFVHFSLMYLLHRLQEQADTLSSSQIASSMGLNNSSLP